MAIASASATTSASATSAKSAATAGRALFARASLVDFDCPAVQILAVKLRDGGLGVCFGTHLHKSDASTAAGEFVHQKVDGLDRAGLAEMLLQCRICRVVGQISNVETLTHVLSFRFSFDS
jgi:hypothetical protein